MSHSRGRDRANPGMFSYECYGYDGQLFRSECGFASHVDADRAAEQAERDMMALQSAQVAGMRSMSSGYTRLTDEALLKELGT